MKHYENDLTVRCWHPSSFTHNACWLQCFRVFFSFSLSSKALREIKQSHRHLRLQSDPSALWNTANKQQICRYKPKLARHCLPSLSQNHVHHVCICMLWLKVTSLLGMNNNKPGFSSDFWLLLCSQEFMEFIFMWTRSFYHMNKERMIIFVLLTVVSHLIFSLSILLSLLSWVKPSTSDHKIQSYCHWSTRLLRNVCITCPRHIILISHSSAVLCCPWHFLCLMGTVSSANIFFFLWPKEPY